MKTLATASYDEARNDRVRRIAPRDGTGNTCHYGSRHLPKAVLRAAEKTIVNPELDRDHFRAVAITNGLGGESDIRDYAVRTFNAENAELEEECRRLIDLICGEEAGAHRHVKERSNLLAATDPYLESTGTTIPWTRFARGQVIFFIILSGLLLSVGINTNAVVLLSSGISAFSSPIRAYLFSLVPIGIAAALKVPGSHLELRSRRLAYTFLVWTIGLVLGIIWAGLFAATFPGLTQDTATLVQNLANTNANSADHVANGGFIFVALLSEAFLAAGCWLSIQLIVEKHQSPARVDNPAYQKVQADLDDWHNRKCENSQLAGHLTGKLRAIDESRRQFVERAVASFRAAVRLAADHKHLDDFLNG
ncbi:MAG: hypothetical protein HY298_20730 [Verrucomicrobia bacterium]|nr:hypothetical protein [Verrucomicrobiota bacterium]